MKIESVAGLYRDPPVVHQRGTRAYPLAIEVASYLSDLVGPRSRTLETGCGLSTALFAMRGCLHVCITPDHDEVTRMLAYLRDRDIDASGVTYLVGRSQHILPGVDLDGLDVVLIDGQHAFPMPFIDWYYCASMLRVGGMLVLDDTQLWTGRVLRQVLGDDSGWDLVRDFFGRTACFRKSSSFTDVEWWGQQPYVVRRSRYGRFAENVRHGISVIAPWRLRRGQSLRVPKPRPRCSWPL